MRTTISDLKQQAAYITELMHGAGIEKTAFVYQANGTQCIAAKPDGMAGNVIDCYITEYGTKSEVQTMAHAWVRGWHMATNR